MSRIYTSRKHVVGIIGAALAGSVLMSGSAFAMKTLPQGYVVAAADTKAAEGKCGEGKCGDVSFEKHDTDKDDHVSRAEFLKAGGSVAGFEQIDKDHDGLISEAEAYKNLQNIYAANGNTMPKGLFAKISD